MSVPRHSFGSSLSLDLELEHHSAASQDGTVTSLTEFSSEAPIELVPSHHGGRRSRQSRSRLSYRASDDSHVPKSWQEVPRWRSSMVLIGLFLGLFISTLDTSIVATALVTITTHFDDFLTSPWIVTAYLLTYMGFAISWARLSDIYGRKRMVMLAWIFFTAFSLGCGLAQTMIQLIVFRAFQGLGGSGLFSLVMTMIPEIVPPEKVGMISGVIGMTLGCSGVLGPILGGVISNYASWRWIFFINVPVGVIAFCMIVLAWPRRFGSSLASWSAFSSIDFVGILLIIATSFLCVYALQYASEISIDTTSYNDPIIIGTAVVSGCCAVALVVWQLFITRYRRGQIVSIFPLHIFKKRVLSAAIISSFLTGFAQITPAIELPERFQLVNATSSTMAGVNLLPLLAASAFGSFLGGALSKKRNNTSYTMIAASCLQALGLGLLSTLGDSISIPAKQYGFQVILGVGVGLSLSASSILTSVQADGGDLAVAQGVVTQVRVLGGALGIAIVAIIFNRQCRLNLTGVLSNEELTALSRSPIAALSFSPNDQSLTRHVYSEAFVNQMRFLTWISVLNIAVSCFTFELRPRSIVDGIRSHQQNEGQRTADTRHCEKIRDTES